MTDFDTLIDSTVEELDFDEAIEQLVHVRKAITDLRVVESLLEQRVGETMPMKEKAVPGIGVVSKSHAKKSVTWELDRLLHRVAARCADEAFDRSTGELVPQGVLAEMVAERIDDCFGIRYAKKTGLRRYGVEFKDCYEAEYETDRWKIRIS